MKKERKRIDCFKLSDKMRERLDQLISRSVVFLNRDIQSLNFPSSNCCIIKRFITKKVI